MEPNKLFVSVIIPNSTTLGFTSSELTNSGLVLALAIARVVTHTKEELQRLRMICMSAKELSFEEPRKSLFKAQVTDLYHEKLHIDWYYFY